MNRSPIKRRSKKENLGKVADGLCWKLVYARDGNCCVRCGKTDRLTPSHILPRGKYPRMRWVLDNILTLCVGCHLFWWHKQPIAAARWLEEKFPGLADRLYLADEMSTKVDVKELICVLKAMVNCL